MSDRVLNNSFSKVVMENLEKMIQSVSDRREFCNQVVNAPFIYSLAVTKLSLGFIAFTMVDRNKVVRLALTDNELADNSKKMSAIRFEELNIPLDSDENLLVKAVKTGKSLGTTDWKYLLIPVLPEFEARLNQAGGGIGYSQVKPFKPRNTGALIFSFYQFEEDLSKEQFEFMNRYTKIVNKYIKPHFTNK